jgi:fatty acid desaturase
MQLHHNFCGPKHDPDHIVSTFGPLWLIAPRFFYHEFFFFQRRLWRRYELLEWGIARGIFFSIVLAAAHFQFLPFIFNCWFAPALSAACLFAATLIPATVPSHAHAETPGTNSALLAALDHANGQSLMNHLASSSFKSTNVSTARSTNALSTGWN